METSEQEPNLINTLISSQKGQDNREPGRSELHLNTICAFVWLPPTTVIIWEVPVKYEPSPRASSDGWLWAPGFTGHKNGAVLGEILFVLMNQGNLSSC